MCVVPNQEQKEESRERRAEYDAMTPQEQVAHDLDRFKNVPRGVQQQMQEQYYNAGIIDAQGNPREGITNPRQMLAIHHAQQLSNPRTTPLSINLFRSQPRTS